MGKPDTTTEAPPLLYAWPDGPGETWHSGGCSTDINMGLMGKQADSQTLYTPLSRLAVLSDRHAAALELIAQLRDEVEHLRRGK